MIASTHQACPAILDEITWWVLGYGPHCVVEAPDALWARVGELARAAARRYAEPGPNEAAPA